MLKRQRKSLPNIPVHVVSYGHQRNSCFFTEDDYRFYILRLARLLKRYQVSLHAYVLLPNHVHLLMTAIDADGISNLVFDQQNHYQQYIKKTYRQSSPIWQSNYTLCHVQPDDFLLKTYFYIELNPVRVGMVDSAAEYEWSSYRYHALNEFNPLIDEHDVFKLLAKETKLKHSLYQQMCGNDLPEPVVEEIQHAQQYESSFGNQVFKSEVEKALTQLTEGAVVKQFSQA